MPINVIKTGLLPEKSLYAGTCSYCKTEAQWEKRDSIVSHDNHALRPTFTRIKCPLCDTLMIGYPASA